MIFLITSISRNNIGTYNGPIFYAQRKNKRFNEREFMRKDQESHTLHIAENKQNFLTSIRVKINIYDHIKIKDDGPNA
jgi:hypothetical protein